MVHACVAYGCSNKFSKGNGIGFFRFPNQSNRRLQWTIAVRRKNFTPSKYSRICGAHFHKGRPSKVITDPDYVPSIFCYTSAKDKLPAKSRTKKLAEDLSELPLVNTQEEDQKSSSDDTLSASEDSDYNDNSNFNEELLPEFEAEVENSPLVSVETVKHILANDASKNPDAVPEKFGMYGKNRIPPTKFTFLDMNGKVLGQFTEKRFRKNTPLEKKTLHHVFSSHTVKQQVQVILDRKTATTAYVDTDSIRGYNELRKIKKESIEEDSYLEYDLIDESFLANGLHQEIEIKEEMEDYESDSEYYENTFSPDTESACENEVNSDIRSEDDLFSWYSSELRDIES